MLPVTIVTKKDIKSLNVLNFGTFDIENSQKKERGLQNKQEKTKDIIQGVLHLSQMKDSKGAESLIHQILQG